MFSNAKSPPLPLSILSPSPPLPLSPSPLSPSPLSPSPPLPLSPLPLSPSQIKLRHADQEIRLAQEPFPLFPGEILKQVVTQLKVVHANTALRLRAVLDFVEDGGTRRIAGDEWLFEGPGKTAVCICSVFLEEVCV